MQDCKFSVKCTVRKRNGTQDSFDINKILSGINKSAQRSEPKFSKLSSAEQERFLAILEQLFFTYDIKDGDVLETSFIEKIVGTALGRLDPNIQKTYREYNLWKSKYADSFCKIKSEVDAVYLRGDRSNANTNSAYVSTKRCIGYNIFNKEMYQMYFLTPQELKECRDGFLYIHDMVARRDTFNCMLFRMADVMTGGFEMGDMWYTEPKSLDVAFDVMLAITKTAAAQQYGGFTIPQIDKLLSKYAEKSYKSYLKEYIDFAPPDTPVTLAASLADNYAMYKVRRDMEQGFQAMEYDLNTIGSSRGDYPFVTITFGLDTSKFGKLVSSTALKVRANGEGLPGHKKIVAFPKLVFLNDDDLHSEGKQSYDVYQDAVRCQSKAMYPDMLSLTGEGYVSEIYKKYKLPISPMGCAYPLEVVTYKLNKRIFVESIARLYRRIGECMVEKKQPGLDKRYTYFDTSYMDLEIYDTKLGFVKMNKMIRNYNDNDWYQVVLDSGRYIQVTHDHPFETENRGVVHACDLIPGEDKIRVNYECYSEETETCPDDLAWFLGLMLCDGCYQCGVVVSIAAQGEDEIQNMFLRVVEKYYMLPTRVKLQERGPKGTYKDLQILSDGTKALEKLKKDFTDLFGGINKKDRQIPPEVFRWNRSAKLAFLGGMMDADGYVVRAGDDANTGHACIGSTNRELAMQQLMLIQSLGMPAKVYANHYKKGSSKIRHKVEFYATNELGAYITCAKKYQAIPEEPGSFVDLNRVRTVVKVVKIDDPDEHYSYDVETESGHFEVSGIYSHNCRAFLSPWFERGGMEPADENDVPVFEGRANIGAISLNLPMIYQKSVEEHKDFYEVLDFYLEMIRNLHQRTYEYLGKMKAGCNPMVFCQGGAYGGHLKPDEPIAPVIKSWTASFGITALNELQVLYNGKTINEDGEFALEVLTYINKQVEKFKKLDGHLYAIYSTPAEALCGTQVKQFRKKYGIIKGVSDKEYFTNSTHCPVYAHITPFEKQDSEKRFWELSNGGHIQYVRYNDDKNLEAFDTINKRSQKMGFYWGHNLDKCYCEDCGYEQLDMKICPKCGSKNITEINRVCGYLGYSKIKGDTRMNDAKLSEIADRVSM
jgi:anaerobic ribonucleoside-triphosphate reductase